MTELIDFIRQGLPCLFHEITGLYCPGCGGTRAVKALLRGDILTSFYYHPVVVYTAGVLLFLLLSYGVSKVLKKSSRTYRYEWFVYAGIGIILVNWVVKNYYLIVKGMDLLLILE